MLAQDILELDPSSKTSINNLATVSIDGTDLFYLRGVLSLPAELRAKTIESRIYAIAKDKSIAPSSIRSVAESDRISIYAGDTKLFSVFDADGEADGMTKEIFSEIIVKKLEQIIQQYRYERSSESLKKGAIKGAIAFGVLILVLLIFSFIFRRLNNSFQKKDGVKT